MMTSRNILRLLNSSKNGRNSHFSNSLFTVKSSTQTTSRATPTLSIQSQIRNHSTASSPVSVNNDINFINNNNNNSDNNSESDWFDSKLSWTIRFSAISLLTFYLFSEGIMGPECKEASDAAPQGSGLNPNEFRHFVLKSKSKYNHNSDIYVFNVQSIDVDANKIPVSSCILFKYIDEKTGKPVIRPYTPIHTGKKGELTFVVKKYAQGNMSQHLAHLEPNETLEMKGPIPKLKYEANMKQRIGMIAGGTGITPMLQVLEQIVQNPSDKTQVDLIFTNSTPQDILLKESIDEYARNYPDKFKIHYIVDKPDSNWKGKTGYVDDELIKQKLAPSKDGKDVLIYVCGPPPFVNLLSGPKAKDMSQGELTGLLATLGYNKDQVFKF